VISLTFLWQNLIIEGWFVLIVASNQAGNRHREDQRVVGNTSTNMDKK
jgi:hypothetical protein